ncbi:hypothetical protein ACQKWADRAFT_292280 [Trichoderma austrokoningii]
MASLNLAATMSINASDTLSHKARRGSPPPGLQTSENAAIQKCDCFTIQGRRNKNKSSDQVHILLGVGSQFTAVDDQTANKDLHIDL